MNPWMAPLFLSPAVKALHGGQHFSAAPAFRAPSFLEHQLEILREPQRGFAGSASNTTPIARAFFGESRNPFYNRSGTGSSCSRRCGRTPPWPRRSFAPRAQGSEMLGIWSRASSLSRFGRIDASRFTDRRPALFPAGRGANCLSNRSIGQFPTWSTSRPPAWPAKDSALMVSVVTPADSERWRT